MLEHTHPVNLALQVVPINTTESYPIIDAAIEVIQASDLSYQVGPFSTSMEGDLSEILACINEAKNRCLEAGAEDLVLNLQIHLKHDRPVHAEDKIQGR